MEMSQLDAFTLKNPSCSDSLCISKLLVSADWILLLSASTVIVGI